ncbi:chemotaxis protein CheW [Telmatospirillum sp.]|uniref:chemotaxis protein CheW n=1 Tax=Telmatospirillum sp. TaxID=2079197 RepID=UPI00284D4EE4|nr:chemotaxis protein CheW [Telmatospirillum sp.]MDR3438327.1 chemotaxis protein CheW [Telmatospirillum sp.]
MSHEDGKDLEVLTFGLQGEIFAVEALSVREILDLAAVTAVPNSNPFVGSLVNVRGKVVPLADLHIRFGMEPFEQTVDTRVIVLEVPLEGEATIVGILADKVFEVTGLAATTMEAAPDIGIKWRREFVSGIGKRGEDFVIVLNMERIFASRDSEPAGKPEDAGSETVTAF